MSEAKFDEPVIDFPVKPSDHSIRSKILAFLDNLAALEGQKNGNFIILPYPKREDVANLAQAELGQDLIKIKTFLTYWSTDRRNITTIEHGSLCIDCGKFTEQLDNLTIQLHKQAPNTPVSADIQRKIEETRSLKDEHIKRAKVQRDLSRQWKNTSYHSQSQLSICMDYASALQLPSTHHKIFDGTHKSKLAVRLGAFVVDNLQNTKYFVHPLFSETSNSIISALYLLLQELYVPTQRTLYLSMDNHATNKSNSMIFFLYHLVLLGWFDEIQILFFIEYEGKNRADTAHAHFFAALRNHSVFDIDDIIASNRSHSIQVQWLQDIRDWASFYKQSNVSTAFEGISVPHKYEFLNEIFYFDLFPVNLKNIFS